MLFIGCFEYSYDSTALEKPGNVGAPVRAAGDAVVQRGDRSRCSA
jgi:hypothetical protein